MENPEAVHRNELNECLSSYMKMRCRGGAKPNTKQFMILKQIKLAAELNPEETTLLDNCFKLLPEAILEKSKHSYLSYDERKKVKQFVEVNGIEGERFAKGKLKNTFHKVIYKDY